MTLWSFVFQGVLLLGGVLVKGNLQGPFCAFAPLCGSANQTFELSSDLGEDFPIFVDGKFVVGGALLEFTDCCSLKDTQPLRDCEIVNPAGKSDRFITTFNPVCSDLVDNCEEGDCENYVIALRPTFISSNQADGCCDTCSCYGDPQCRAFDGTEKMWLLCEGREVPKEEDHWERCRITRDVCLSQKDHAGNQCTYLAKNKNGKGWSNIEKGSPCVPNPDSPPSIITMYEVPSDTFSLKLEQGERGTIIELFLTMTCGEFSLSADDCLNDGNNAWQHSLDELPAAFHYEKYVESRDVLWNIVDPDSGIAIMIRCYGNKVPGSETEPGGVYVPRINVESLSDPNPSRSDAEGFCVSGEFDTGLATTNLTEWIEQGRLCIDGLENFTTLEVFREICQNPAMPQSGISECTNNYCSKYFMPLYESIDECVKLFSTDMAEGFCRGIVYLEEDVDECIDQWNELGPIATIDQYYNDRSGCISELPTSPEECQAGVTLQYLDDDGITWVDIMFIPEDYCAEGTDGNGQILLTKCEYEELFTRPIRFMQSSSDVNCAPVNQCKRIDGFQTYIAITIPPTPSPTQASDSPTASPTDSPITTSPTPSPSVSPSRFPTGEDTLPPTPLCTYHLCETPELYSDIDEQSEMFHTRMESCCPIPPQVACPNVPQDEIDNLNRSQGSNQPYCGNKFPEAAPFKNSCLNNDKLQFKVMFARNEDTQCCKSCTCFGDPRCYSFNNTFKEFILCDGRTAPESGSPDDRCIIRKDTCLQQKDHAGNACTWANPYVPVPNFNDPVAQAQAEADFSIPNYGSPCRYDENLSPPSLINLYRVDDFELVAQQEERGYIHNLYLKTHNGRYTLNVTECLRGDNWFVNEKFTDQNDFFSKTSFGSENLWTVVDTTTNIEMSVRCTGVFANGRITLGFLNVEYVNEPDEDRIGRGFGFCATGEFVNREQSSWQHSDDLLNAGFCSDYNSLVTPIVLRNVARAIIDYPGLSTLGTEWAYTDFCTQHFAPNYKSIQQCVSAFMNAKNVNAAIKAFCKAVTLDSKPCIESIQTLAESVGYEEAFNQARVQYVDTYNEICTVTSSNDLLDFIPNEDACKSGVELQYNHPFNGWTTYKAFPTDQAPCNGFMVEFVYKNDKPLFEYPIRVLQKYYPRDCSACSYVNTVDAWFQFVPV